eukprot:TRINITY_DN4403_c0_g1_i2.p1 TRINITY_DN4403_c0_g1~~TRINITY_DN4403_c0_g1_i2.p1  ORF type:complete len:350 (+),score=82.74 TRINITY_DN4403_c0_g1_i2:46-1050(+)
MANIATSKIGTISSDGDFDPQTTNAGSYLFIQDHSSDVLNFDVPKTFSLVMNKKITTHIGGHISLPLPVVPSFHISYCSAPLSSAKVDENKTINALSTPEIPISPPLSLPVIGSWFIAATADTKTDFHIDYIHRLTKNWTTKLYGVTTMNLADTTDVVAEAQYDAPTYCVQLKAGTDNMVLGGNFLKKINNNWAAGAELFYTHTQASGGFSVGMRYRDASSPYGSHVNSTFNTMGDLTTCFSSFVVPDILSASTRYSFNVNNHNSDLAIGLKYTPRDLPVIFKGRYDFQTREWGLISCWRLVIQKIRLNVNVGVQRLVWSQKSPSFGVALQIGD